MTGKNGRPRKLSEAEERRVVILLRLRRRLTDKALSKTFGVSQNTLHAIARRAL